MTPTLVLAARRARASSAPSRSRFRSGVHPLRPCEKARQVAAVLPDKAPEVLKSDFVGRNAPVGFHAPAQIGAAPGTKPISPGGAPQEAQHHLSWLRDFLD